MGQTKIFYDQIYGAVAYVGIPRPTAAENTTAIVEACTALNAAGGGELRFEFANYDVNYIDLRGFKYITLQGIGSPTNAGASADQPISQSRLSCTSGGMDLIDLRSTYGFALKNMGFHSASDSFNGRLIRLGRDTGGDSRNTVIDFCGIGGGPVNNFVNSSAGIDLDKAVNVEITNCKFISIQTQAINGKISGASSYSNSVLIQSCNFEKCGNNGDAVIKDPGFAWTIQSCTFQENRSGGMYVLSNGSICQAFKFIGNDMYNDGTPVAGAIATLNLTAINGFEISGNRIVGSNKCISLLEAGSESCEGGVIQGNVIELDGAAGADLIGIDFGLSGAAVKRKNIHIGPNKFWNNATTFNENIRVGTGQVEGLTISGDPDTTESQHYVGQDTSLTTAVSVIDCLRTGTSVERMLDFKREGTLVGSFSASNTGLRLGAGSLFIDFDNTLTKAVLTGSLKSTLGIQPGTTTSAEINAIGDAVNTSNKDAAYTLYNTTTGLLTTANGAGAGDTWTDTAGTVFTPS